MHFRLEYDICAQISRFHQIGMDKALNPSTPTPNAHALISDIRYQARDSREYVFNLFFPKERQESRKHNFHGGSNPFICKTVVTMELFTAMSTVFGILRSLMP